MIAKNITKKRIQMGLSQQEVADNLKVSRNTYAKIEKGTSSPTVAMLQKIAERLHTTTEDLMSENQTEISALLPTTYQTIESESKPELIDNGVTFKPEVFRQVLLYILSKVGAKHNVGETVLYKLLYFIDFDYYEKHSTSITGMTYVKNHYGPTPQSAIYDSAINGLLKKGDLAIVMANFYGNKQKRYLPAVDAGVSKLTAEQLQHIDEELARLSDKTAKELSEFSHFDMPWVATKIHDVIDYELTYYRAPMTSVMPEDNEN